MKMFMKPSKATFGALLQKTNHSHSYAGGRCVNFQILDRADIDALCQLRVAAIRLNSRRPGRPDRLIFAGQ